MVMVVMVSIIVLAVVGRVTSRGGGVEKVE
jgi:hypothetical protein